MQNILFETYNSYKNNLNRIIKKSKREYFVSKFNGCKNDTKNTWTLMNSILAKNIRKSEKITLLDGHGGEVLEPVDVANTFCEYFSTVANRLDADIPLTNTDLMYCMPPDPVSASFSPSPATISEVQKMIAAFSNKPSKINVLLVFVFKKLSFILALVICDIFNTSKNQRISPPT